MIRLTNHQLTAEIAPKGAEIHYLSKTNGTNVLWSVDPIYWNRCAPILFPIVGKLKNDSYTWDNQKYNLTQHGFARDHVFQLVESTADKAVFLLRSSAETAQNYPFAFDLLVHYQLIENKLITTYTIKNTGENVLPFSIGGHPGFALHDALENYALQFPQAFSDQRHLIKEGLYTGETNEIHFSQTYPLKTSDFEQDAIVLKQPKFNQVTLLHKGNEVLTMQCEDWTAIGFWTKKNAPFFCIEPWWGWADKSDASGQLTEKEGLIWLSPQEQKSVSFTIELH